MTAIRIGGLEGFLRRPDSSIGGLLVYGEEPGAVRDIAARVVKRLAGSTDDPFAVVSLQDSDLVGDSGRLADEVQSQSMFGGNRVVWVRDAGDGLLKAIDPILDGKVSGNFIVAEAGILAKSSKLRQAFEKNNSVLILPLYEADAAETAGAIESMLRDSGLSIDQDAVHRFIELVGTHRSLVQQEVEKLSLYCLGSQRISFADVEAVCGNDTGTDPDSLVDSVFQGDVHDADRLFHNLIRSGVDAGRIVSVVHGHALRLQDFRIAIERGLQPDQVLRSARPPVFFKRQPKVQAQLRAWPLDELVKAGATLGTAVLQARLNAPLAEALAGRCLLSLARKGLQLRNSRN